MYDVLPVCNVALLKSYHVLSLRSVILLQRQCYVLKALFSWPRLGSGGGGGGVVTESNSIGLVVGSATKVC